MPETPIAGPALCFEREAIFICEDLACFLEALYQRDPVSDLAVAGYLGFIISNGWYFTTKLHKTPNIRPHYHGRFIERL